MPRRAVPAALVLGAALADASGAHRLAFYALLAAIPFAAAAALQSLGASLERRDDHVAAVQAMLWALCVALVVAGSASRAHAVEAGTLPAFARSMLSGALLVLAVKASLWSWSRVRGRLVVPRASRA